MRNRDIMLNALNSTVVKELKSQGFTGKYPHFKREKKNCIELISFQTNKYGGSFTVEVSAIFPDSKVTNLIDENIEISKANVFCTNERYRLKGMFDGWFYYSDVYRMPQGFYHNVLEKEKDTFNPSDDWELLQAFDELVAEEISEEISLQLDDAFDWLFKLESKSIKHVNKKEEEKNAEEKVINKRVFVFPVAFLLFFSIGMLLLGFDKTLGILLIVIAIMALTIMVMTPVGYIFSEERLVIKYLFGFEEVIIWANVFSVMTRFETSKGIYITQKDYELNYRAESKRHFFMQGRIAKNKRTTELMEKYCPKRID